MTHDAVLSVDIDAHWLQYVVRACWMGLRTSLIDQSDSVRFCSSEEWSKVIRKHHDTDVRHVS